MDPMPTLVRSYVTCQDLVRSASLIDIATGLVAVWALRVAIRTIRKKSRTTKLRGPKSTSLLFGVGKELFESPDSGALFEAWSKEYGVVYEIPMICGQKRVILCDPRAAAYLFARDTWSYVGIPGFKAVIARRVGKGLNWAEGESHRRYSPPWFSVSPYPNAGLLLSTFRQRRSIAPSFNSTAIRKLSPTIHQAVDRLKAAWQASIDVNGGESVVLDVTKWMNYVSLDSFGSAGFSYDFGSLDGKPNSTISVLDAFGAHSPRTFLDNVVSLLSFIFPMAMNVPTWRNKMLDKLRERMSETCDMLVDNATKEKGSTSNEQVSTIGLLLKAEDEDSGKRIVREEVLAQLSTLIFASYETTATTMTWALVELARHPDIQTKLREELSSFGREPLYDELTTGLPYLDAIVQETLRLHPAVPELIRQADEDDIIPLSEPVRAKSGEVIDSIAVERGTVFVISTSYMNRSEAIWGPDAKVFRPDRWIEADGVTKKAQEVKGHRHLFSFGDGPRSCIGKLFAVAEVKTVLSVVVRNFVLEMRDGPDTKVEITRRLTLRPKVAGEAGIKVPLRVRQYRG
ncbi:cytochrome P450 [Pisolithus orientalis]|uniref:cytochrome P450 n=1 Tax=Pisolithus orientalis TaxID=936130 RepID=UPI002224885D|nr:cytochrome P450 [Pisolithus orientalis]KAI6004499.1 cytochrome P450 [Pisolithus orientalis]